MTSESKCWCDHIEVHHTQYICKACKQANRSANWLEKTNEIHTFSGTPTLKKRYCPKCAQALPIVDVVAQFCGNCDRKVLSVSRVPLAQEKKYPFIRPDKGKSSPLLDTGFSPPTWLRYVGVGIAGYIAIGFFKLMFIGNLNHILPGLNGVPYLIGIPVILWLYRLKRKNSSKYDISKQSPPSQTRRPSQAATNTQLDCLECGVENPSVAKHCISCGASLPTNICQKCQTKNLSEAKFCMSCGESI